MSTIKHIEKINQLHSQIKNGITGSSKVLAERMNLSVRSVQSYLDELRQMGAEISYDSHECTYYYKNGFDIKYHFEIIVSASPCEKEGSSRNSCW